MTTLHETEVDGVRTFWVETGRPTLAARLMFRGGIADEPINESGWQHLIEHMAIDKVRRADGIDINGHVALVETAFDAHGEVDAVVTYLTALTAWLTAPEFDRLEHETGILRAEADLRASTPGGRALSWRYGARGPGLVSFNEPGLGRATPERLRGRVERIFTAGNAVLALDGPPPAGLRLTLPSGALLPLRSVLPVDEPPAMYEEHAGLVVSGAVPRDGDMFVGVEVLRRELTERLRYEDGGAYAPWSQYERLDSTTAFVVAGSDLRPELAESVGRTAVDILDRLASAGPDEAIVRDTIERVVRTMRDPYAAMGAAVSAASMYLHGREPQTPAQLIDRVQSVSASGLQEDFERLRRSLFLGAPPTALGHVRLRRLEFPTSAPSQDATVYRSINWPGDESRLRITARALELQGQRTRSIQFDDVAGWYVHADGSRQAVQTDGYSLSVDPRNWRDGAIAVAQLDARIPLDRHLPHPPRDVAPLAQRSFWARWWPAIRRSPATGILAVAFCVVVAIGLIVALVVAGASGAAGPVVIMSVLAIRLVREATRT